MGRPILYLQVCFCNLVTLILAFNDACALVPLSDVAMKRNVDGAAERKKSDRWPLSVLKELVVGGGSLAFVGMEFRSQDLICKIL